MPIPPAIENAIMEAREYFTSPPPNESSTCEWVILPLLLAAGYARRDILPRVMDNNKQFPDYTLLPHDAAHKWFLEAKAWQIDLEHAHALQALNYANGNGARWVLLTNGWSWRLYDNAVLGLPPDKLVVEVYLEDPERFAEFLVAIGKESVLSGGRERLAEAERERIAQQARAALQARQEADRRERLASLLPAQLTDENSLLIEWMQEVLGSQEGLEGLTAGEVVAYFQAVPGIGGAESLEGSAQSEEPEAGDAPVLSAAGETSQVLVVAAFFALQEYLTHSAYICQAKRTFRPTSHLAFYLRGRIDRHVPRILDQVESVVLTEEAIHARTDLPAKTRDRLLSLVESLKTKGQIHNRIGYEAKVLFLSAPDAPETIRLKQDVENDLTTAAGKPWPFTAGQRYASLARLKASPATTTELLNKTPTL